MQSPCIAKEKRLAKFSTTTHFCYQSGAIAVMAAFALIIIIAFFGLALDLSRLYNRKVELQSVADTLALAAAMELNGTEQGVEAALAKAAERLNGTVAGALTYQYGSHNLAWSADAIRFAASPDGPWDSASATTGRAGTLLYAKADTRGLAGTHGAVETFFARFFSDLSWVSVDAQAVAGRSALGITPLGICALRPGEPHRDHGGELEEYGFRRGVSYNLTQLGPDSTQPPQIFLIDPRGGSASDATAERAAPYVCTGTVDIVQVSGTDVRLAGPFPLADLSHHLNSRFDLYSAPFAPCSKLSAPPDANIKQYSVSATGGVAWMIADAGRLQASASSQEGGKLWTIAGPDQPPAGTTAGMFGPLWAYAKAARYSSYQASGGKEPASGYSTFGTGDWAALYNAPVPPVPRLSTSPGYPSRGGENSPYLSTSSSFHRQPANPGVRGRRILNLPLLNCPVSGNYATVLGIGKFFMTVQASSTALYAEFGGLANESSLGTRIDLQP
ncbi:pilus assembly protein TadG-related protein [Massilia sp.]|uniref:pilus assembly protein TadG-related protein n=1 Tax=Massilia sp. TaxID=1882437 RepID=UPI0028982D08|nr:pilus assembly protein TadG-related protein [Massilia sp.]